MEKELEEIGNRLQLIRKKLKLQQKEMASALEISNATISEIEAGHTRPQFSVIYNLTTKYNVNIYYLLHGRGVMFMPEDIDLTARTEISGENAEFLQEFFHYFKASPLVRLTMMSVFKRFMLEKKKLIDKDIRNEKAKNTARK